MLTLREKRILTLQTNLLAKDKALRLRVQVLFVECGIGNLISATIHWCAVEYFCVAYNIDRARDYEPFSILLHR